MSWLTGKDLKKAQKAYAEFKPAAEAFQDAMRKFDKKCPDIYGMIEWMEDVDECLYEMDDLIHPDEEDEE